MQAAVASSAIAGFRTTHRASSLDEAALVGNRVFYPHQLTLLTPRVPLSMAMTVGRLGPITIGEVEYGTDVQIRVDGGELHAYHVNIPLSGRLESRYGRNEVTANPKRAAVYGPTGDVFLTRWTGDCRQLCIKIDRQALEAEHRVFRGREISTPLAFAPSLDLGRGPGLTWLKLVLLVADEMRRGSSLSHAPVALSLANSVLTGLLFALDQAGVDDDDALPGRVRPLTLRHAVDIMEDEANRPLTVTELATRCHVSVRALQKAFRRELGTSPIAYLRAVRLRRAHEELVRSDPLDTTVAEIAVGCGFPHASRFASVYRATYGVAPSETLNR